MVTQIYHSESVQTFYIKSTDTKPSGCKNGDIVVYVNTGERYMYDEENNLWRGIRGVEVEYE